MYLTLICDPRLKSGTEMICFCDTEYYYLKKHWDSYVSLLESNKVAGSHLEAAGEPAVGD